MQSSLSPQSNGLYSSNFAGGDCPFGAGDAVPPIPAPTTYLPSPCKDYLLSPQMTPINSARDGNWTGRSFGRGNDNPTGGSRRFNSSGYARNFLNTAITDIGTSGRVFNPTSGQAAPPKFLAGNISNATSPRGMDPDRDRIKDRLIESLSKSDMITCLPGFKRKPFGQESLGRNFDNNAFSNNRTYQEDMAMSHGTNASSVPTQRSIATMEMPPALSDKRNIENNGYQQTNQDEVTMSPGARSSSLPTQSFTTMDLPPPPAAYARQAPLSLPPVPNSSESGAPGEFTPSRAPNYERESPVIPASHTFNNAITQIGSGSEGRLSPPASPLSRAKLAIGVAQSEIAKINTCIEGYAEKQKPPGAWSNMGTPNFSASVVKSFQKQQKDQYRMALEQQILASKRRKAEEARQERDGTDHPLGPEYAHPALTYYNPPRKITNNNQRNSNFSATALTNYMKEKYCLGGPASGPNGGNSVFPARCTESGGPAPCYENRITPLQQSRKEKALGNLIKSRTHPADHYNGSHLPQISGDTRLHTGVIQQGSRFPHQQQQYQQRQNFPHHPQSSRGLHQSPYPPQNGHHRPGTYSAPPRPQGMQAWPMYNQYPPYTVYYGPYGQHVYQRHKPGQPMVPNQNQAQSNRHKSQERNRLPLPPQHQMMQHQHPELIVHEDQQDDASEENGENDRFEFDALKEMVYQNQKIWQTSDELPDPELRTAVYKAELRKQIDEDRRRKADRAAREQEEEERVERKIREFQDEERRRIMMEQQARAELDRYHVRTKIENTHKRNEAFTISQRKPRPPQNLMAEKFSRYGPEAGDYHAQPVKKPPAYNGSDFDESATPNKEKVSPRAAKVSDCSKAMRKSSPPVPVVQKKLIECFLLDEDRENQKPRRQMSSVGQNFLLELKSKLKSERDLVERRLQEKVESTYKNMNLHKHIHKIA